MKTKYKAALFRFYNRTDTYYLLPATPEAYSHQVAAMASSISYIKAGEKKRHFHFQIDIDAAKEALAAIGIKHPKSVPPATADRKGGK